MTDHATPNLPSRDFAATAAFYRRLEFDEVYRDTGWMILGRGEVRLEFFPFPDLDPSQSSFMCCLRLDDADGFYAACRGAGLPERIIGQPRIEPLRLQAWGGRVGALVDPDGTLLRIIANGLA
jgi:catechol 2,3-dioxygenase-like lactoylglutathione lyase family enzyme